MLNQMCNKNVFYFTSLGGGQRRGVGDHRHMVVTIGGWRTRERCGGPPSMIATIGWWGAGERCGGPPSHDCDSWRVGGAEDHSHMVATICQLENCFEFM